MATRFERDVGRGTCGAFACHGQSFDFGMRSAELTMVSLADDLGPLRTMTQPTIGFGSTRPRPSTAKSKARAMCQASSSG